MNRGSKSAIVGLLAFGLLLPSTSGAFASDELDPALTPVSTEEVVDETTPEEVTSPVEETVQDQPVEDVVVEEVVPEGPPIEPVIEEPSSDEVSDNTPPVVKNNGPPQDDQTNSEEYWEDLLGADECIKFNPEDVSVYGELNEAGTGVVLYEYDFESVTLIVKGGSVDNGDGPGNVVYYDPEAGEVYLAPLNAGGQQSEVSHWILCYDKETVTPPMWQVTPSCEDGNTIITEGDLVDGVYVTEFATSTFVATDTTVTITHTPKAGFVFAEPGEGDLYTLNEDGTATVVFDFTEFYEDCEPPTVEDCVTTGSYLVTNLNEQGFNYSPLGTPYADTRADGQYAYVDGALRLTTLNANDAASTNKVSGARAVDIPLAQYGGDFAVNFVASYGTIEPGINIRLDADNDGDIDVTLTAEPNVAGYLTFWTNTPGYLPASQGGQGGAYAGDQDDILALWPDARVKVEAFALGSGVGTDGDLISWSTPCNTYTYDYVEEVEPEVVTPPMWQVTPSCEDGNTIITEGDLVDGVYVTEFATSTFVATDTTVTITHTPKAGFVFAEPGEGDLYTLNEDGTATVVFDFTEFYEDCDTVVPPPSPSIDLSAKCGSADVAIDYPAYEGEGFNASATAMRTWEVKADGVVIDTITLNPGESFEKTYVFAEDSSGGSVTVTLGEVDAPVAPLSVEVDTDCKEAPPVLAFTGASGSVLILGILAFLAMIVGAIMYGRRNNALA